MRSSCLLRRLAACYILAVVTTASAEKYCAFTHPYTVYLVNNLPKNSTSPFVVHCASKNDDLGNHTVAWSKDYHFEFCDHFLTKTLFFCHVWWEGKDAAFVAFKESYYGKRPCKHDLCYWAVMSDGIYLSSYNPPRGLVKKYDWGAGHHVIHKP